MILHEALLKNAEQVQLTLISDQDDKRKKTKQCQQEDIKQKSITFGNMLQL